MNKFFVLSYDVARLPFDHEKLIVFIKNNKHVEDWYSPFDGCLIFEASVDVGVVATSMFEFLGSGSPFYISEMAKSDSFGAVPDGLWEWFGKPRPGMKFIHNLIGGDDGQ